MVSINPDFGIPGQIIEGDLHSTMVSINLWQLMRKEMQHFHLHSTMVSINPFGFAEGGLPFLFTFHYGIY